MDNPDQLAAARAYVQARPRDSTSGAAAPLDRQLAIKQAKLPSVADYRSQVRRMVPYFRALGVREFGTWNEANHASQPTYRSPTRAALVLPRDVPRGQGPLPHLRGRRARRPRPARRRALHAQLLPARCRRPTASARRSSASTTTATSTASARRYTRRDHHARPTTTTVAPASGSPRPAGIVKFGSSFPCTTDAREEPPAQHVLSPSATGERRGAPLRLQLDRRRAATPASTPA